jgi:hypothetical protein
MPKLLRSFLAKGPYWLRLIKIFCLATVIFIIGELVLYLVGFSSTSERLRARFYADILVVLFYSFWLAGKIREDEDSNNQKLR